MTHTPWYERCSACNEPLTISVVCDPSNAVTLLTTINRDGGSEQRWVHPDWLAEMDASIRVHGYGEVAAALAREVNSDVPDA